MIVTGTSEFDLQHMSLHALARLIRKDWKNVNFAAAPYLDAMATMDSVDTQYGYDSGDSIVRYFLSNASTYGKRTSRGIVDPADVKRELKRRIK